MPVVPESLLADASAERSSADADHLAGITFDEPAGTGAGSEPAPAGGAAVLSKDDFFANFSGLFNVAAALTHLGTLAVDTADPAARGASDAIYDTAADTPWLRFLIEPSNVWIQRAMALGAFAAPKALAVRAELASRGRAAKPAVPANDTGHAADPFAGFPKDAKAAA